MPRRLNRDDEIIKYLIAFQAKHFRMPTRKEAAHDLKSWPGVLDRIFIRLVANGRLKRIPFGVLPFKVLK